jgi:putative heme iron utilization protein
VGLGREGILAVNLWRKYGCLYITTRERTQKRIRSKPVRRRHESPAHRLDPIERPCLMPEQAPPKSEFDPADQARMLLRTVRAGALATLDRDTGFPFASLVTVATDWDGSPLLLMSRLSNHTQNLEADERASLLLAETGKGDPLAHPRLTVLGRARRDAAPRIRSRFLARQPKARLYADFPDFSFWRLEMQGAHLNGGFARAASVTAAGLKTDLTGADDLLAAEEGALEHLNRDHADALNLYATHLAGASAGMWRATGLDPEGLDLMAGDRTTRLAFPRPVKSPGALRLLLKELADEARALSHQALPGEEALPGKEGARESGEAP